MIACVSDDRLGRVFEQMTDHDAVGICALGPETSRNRLVWWSFLVGGAVNRDRSDRHGDAGRRRPVRRVDGGRVHARGCGPDRATDPRERQLASQTLDHLDAR
jgi:hypothetical protein